MQKHLSIMKELVKNSNAETNVVNCITKMTSMTEGYTAYDYMVVRKNLYKFFEGRHIKVSLFIQDQIQGLDGTIYLDFSGPSCCSSIQPGKVIYHDPKTGIESSQKEIPLIQAEKWEAYPFNDRISQPTRDWIGSNTYAADRQKLPTPWRPESVNDKVIEQIKQKKQQA